MTNAFLKHICLLLSLLKLVHSLKKLHLSVNCQIKKIQFMTKQNCVEKKNSNFC